MYPTLKIKITNSILKQLLRSTKIDFKVGEILGWCIYGELKYIICYRRDFNSLSKFPMFRDLITDNDNFTLKVSLVGKYTPLTYVSETEKENNDFVELLKKVKHDAEIRGQFFV